jgi:tetratricopeptide (TPR) repeat protein
MTELRVESLTLPGARLEGENPLPFFRSPQTDIPVNVLENVPEDKRLHFGWQAGFRVLPYRMQDRYSRRREPLTFRSVVLENETLRAIFLPELGSRLVSLYDKQHERELLHRNPVFQPANLAIRNAWFSGGIEWNIGQYGHTFTTCSPVFAAAIQGAQGEPGLRIYEFERCKKLFWQIDFYLPPGLPFLVAYTRVINPYDRETSMYWWTNIAANEAPGVRVLASARQALHVDFSQDKPGFGLMDMPYMPSLDGKDGTYSLNATFANEFFFQCDEAEMPWEAALDGDGRGLVEASTRRLKYRKLFCWGTHAGGRHWQEFLSEPGQAYLEIQAGLAPTQLHGLPMPAGEVWDWTQVFGYLEAAPGKVHSTDWSTATGSVEAALNKKLSTKALYALEENCRLRADDPSGVILQSGSGWGALELRRRATQPEPYAISPAFVFPQASLGAEQEKWMYLLEGGTLPTQAPGNVPGEWMVQADWEALLQAASEKAQTPDWYALLHLGVMRMERFDEAGAEAAWLESIQVQSSAWAYRNLAVLKRRQQDELKAAAYYQKSWETALQQGCPDAALAVEVMQALVGMGQYAQAMRVYRSLPGGLQQLERLLILSGQAALELDDLDSVEAIFGREYAGVREGETVLTDLWFEVQARREARRTGRPLDADLRQKVQQEFKPPANIDFRSKD